jgi:hypothetical protein
MRNFLDFFMNFVSSCVRYVYEKTVPQYTLYVNNI